MLPEYVPISLIASKVDFAAVPRQILSVYSTALRLELSKEDKLKCSITLVTPVALDEVIIVALSEAAYTFAQADREGLEQQISQNRRIIRQGQVLSVHEGLEYNVIMTMPVHQGYVDLERTQTIVASGINSTNYESLDSPNPSSSVPETSDDLESEIDETFLLNSALGTNTNTQNFTQETFSENERSMLFNAKHLQRSHWVPKDQFRDITVLIRTVDLARLGVFSGDWVS